MALRAHHSFLEIFSTFSIVFASAAIAVSVYLNYDFTIVSRRHLREAVIPYHVYKVLHLTAVFMVVMSLGAMALHAANGGGKKHPLRKTLMYTHGIGLIIAFVAGFGLLARLGFAHDQWPPGWAIAKISIWLIFGALSAVFMRKPQWAKLLWFTVIVLFSTAAYLANYKPF